MSNASGSCCATGRAFAVVALVVATSVSTTGWIVTAARERAGAAPGRPEPVPALVPVVSEPGPPGVVQVLVASKDLPVGTMLSRDDLKSAVKIVSRHKGSLPPFAVINPDDVADKRLARPVRAEEVISALDLSKGGGGGFALPDGFDMMSLHISAEQSAAGFIGPGSRVNVIATRRDGDNLETFPLLVNVMVVAVDTDLVARKEGAPPNQRLVSFAVREKEALLLSLAKSCGYAVSLALVHPDNGAEADKRFNDLVKKLIAEDVAPAPRPVERE